MEDRSNEVLAVAILFLITSWITVGLRVYVRAGMRNTFSPDDWAMVATLLLFTAYATCQIASVRYGMGKHAEDLDPNTVHLALQYWFICQLFYVLCSSMLKIALGIFFLRFATKRTHVWIVRFLMIGTGLWGTGYFFLILFQCTPITNFWNVAPGSGKCLDKKYTIGATYAACAVTAIADWTFGILPIFFVWDLKLGQKAKIYIAGLLAFAAIGSTATIVRIPFIHGLSNTHDFLWSTTDLALWSTVEPGIGITAGCMATLRPLLQVTLWHVGLSSSPPSGATRLGDRGRQGHGSRWGHHRRSIWLGNLRPDNVGTITSVTGPSKTSKRDRSSSMERIFGGGITKVVVVEYISESEAG